MRACAHTHTRNACSCSRSLTFTHPSSLAHASAAGCVGIRSYLWCTQVERLRLALTRADEATAAVRAEAETARRLLERARAAVVTVAAERDAAEAAAVNSLARAEADGAAAARARDELFAAQRSLPLPLTVPVRAAGSRAWLRSARRSYELRRAVVSGSRQETRGR
jgi:hypothetical protein